MSKILNIQINLDAINGDPFHAYQLVRDVATLHIQSWPEDDLRSVTASIEEGAGDVPFEAWQIIGEEGKEVHVTSVFVSEGELAPIPVDHQDQTKFELHEDSIQVEP